jgi:hypothetical protein
VSRAEEDRHTVDVTQVNRFRLAPAILTAVAGVVAVVGALTPWATYRSFGFTFTPAGIDEFVGAYVVLAIGVIALPSSGLMYAGWLGPRRWAAVLLVGFVVMSVIAGHATVVLYNYTHPHGQHVNRALVGKHLKPGIWLVYASAGCLLVAALSQLFFVRRSFERPQRAGFSAGTTTKPGDAVSPA